MLLPKRHWSPEQNVVDTKLFGLRSHGEPEWSGADYEKARVHDLQYAALGLIECRNAPFDVTLTGEAVTNAYSKWFTLDFNAQLAARTRGCSFSH
jgi:hypothetical protein